MVLGKLQPWVAVMENVKGMLSAQYGDEPVFYDVMEALQNAGGRDHYRLLALAPATGSRSWKDGPRTQGLLGSGRRAWSASTKAPGLCDLHTNRCGS